MAEYPWSDLFRQRATELYAEAHAATRPERAAELRSLAVVYERMARRAKGPPAGRAQSSEVAPS
jgi:hypothetical protein